MSEDRLQALYRMYGPVVYARCRSILGDSSAAEDATQETFMRVYNHLDKAPDGREALVWIHRLATNYCLSEIRKARHRPEPAELPDRPGANLEECLIDRDFARRLIAACPEKARPVAYLCYVDGMAQGEVAELLDISRRTVVNRLSEFHQYAEGFLKGQPR